MSALLFASSSAWAQLRFSEVYVAPIGADDSAYVEIVNTGDETVYLAEWGIISRGPSIVDMGLRTFSATGYLRPGETYIVAVSPDSFQQKYERYPDSGFDLSSMTERMLTRTHPLFGRHADWWMERETGGLQLFNPESTIEDGLRWGGATAGSGESLPAVGVGIAFHRNDPALWQPGETTWTTGTPSPAEPLSWGCGPPLCGNGELEPGEECDDGNTASGDGCSATCEVEPGGHCVHEFAHCGRVSGAASHCVVLDEVCAQDMLLTAVRVNAGLDRFFDGADWLEVYNASLLPLPLIAFELLDLLPVYPGRGADVMEPGPDLAPGERLLILNRRIPVNHAVDSGYADFGSYADNTGFDLYFGAPKEPYAVRYPRVPGDRSARWPDGPLHSPIILAPRIDQVMLHCARDATRTLDAFSYARSDQVPTQIVPGWTGPRKQWYPELVEESIISSVVFRRYPETQDTDTAADWHLSRCPDPGHSAAHREAPAGGADLTRDLPADGRNHSILLSEDVRNRADATLWTASGLDPRVQLNASNGSISVQAPTEPDFIEVEWFAMTDCWISDRYRATLRFGNPVRCFPDVDGDGYGDLHATGVVVADSCPAGLVEDASDCDDNNAAVHPGATERCDGLDNDCNPATTDGADEPWFHDVCDGGDSDLCENGILACVFGHSYCIETGTGILDYCDGLDNDCNPATPDGHDDPRVGAPCDSDDADLCVNGVTICQAGAIVCDEPYDPSTLELCDGLDNDCNLGTPDGYDEPNFGARCEVGVGACLRVGAMVCENEAMSCSAAPGAPAASDTTCDGVDDDCNGLVDDGVPEIAITCGVGACQNTGIERCEDGAIIADCTPYAPTPETFESGLCSDGIDNDCDGLIDEDDPDCMPLRRCYYDADGDTWPGTLIELRAEDCDGEWEGRLLADDNWDCNDDPSDPCALVTFNGAMELCDGCDNDCSGEVDDIFPRLGTSCGDTMSHCEERVWACSEDGLSLACTTRPVDQGAHEESMEAGTCDDGIDNDCNGLTDFEDPNCVVATTGGRAFGCAAGDSPRPWWPALALLLVALCFRRLKPAS